ncbi:MAG: protein arginine kinase [Thermoguttaceae bacterium]|nr:protein arginine kinase [Thermoguttaceae bacterium]
MDARIAQLVTNVDTRLACRGPESDVVFSSRVRLARNLAGYPFVDRLSVFDREKIISSFTEASAKLLEPDSYLLLGASELQQADLLCLLERQLISREFLDGEAERAVLVERTENFSIMVIEEDHLRMQALAPGFDLETPWRRVNDLDNRYEEFLPYAFDEKHGYLTACPSNVGTGARMSVMLHLPALILTNESERAFRAIQTMNLELRGLYGEGSKPLGDFYQVSNQATLGLAEEEILHHLMTVIPKIVEYERKARERLIEKEQQQTLDRIYRGIGILKSARKIRTEEAMTHLSFLRMGAHLGLQDEVPAQKIDELFLRIQPAHLELAAGRPLDDDEALVRRAEYLRRELA